MPEVDHTMDWNEEVQSLARDIQLEQRSHDLFVWSQEFASRTETDTIPGKKRAKNWLQNSGG